jgi:hypothetical protein
MPIKLIFNHFYAGSKANKSIIAQEIVCSGRLHKSTRLHMANEQLIFALSLQLLLHLRSLTITEYKMNYLKHLVVYNLIVNTFFYGQGIPDRTVADIECVDTCIKGNQILPVSLTSQDTNRYFK